MKESEINPMFDWGLYGYLIRKRRTDMGYKKAAQFAASMWRRTRIEISRDTLYKIEQGKQQPTAEQFMALNIVLYNRPFPIEVFNLCSSNEWKEIQTGDVDSIPIGWKHENYAIALEEAKNMQAEAEQGEGASPLRVDNRDECLIRKWIKDDPHLFSEMPF